MYVSEERAHGSRQGFPKRRWRSSIEAWVPAHPDDDVAVGIFHEVQQRDAILAAAYANDQKDYELLVGAFARRGAGIGATGPDRGSSTNGPVSESFASGADFTVVSVTLDDAVHSCDHDGILDNDEVGHLTVKLRNTGSIPLAASATVASSNPAVSDDSGGMLTFPVAAPYTTTTATMRPRNGNRIQARA